MKLTMLVGAAAVAAVGSFSAADAEVVSLGWNLTGQGNPVTLLSSVAIPGTTTYQAPPSAVLDGFVSNTLSGGDFSPLSLGSTTFDAAVGGTPPLFLYVSETGVTNSKPGVPEKFTSGLTTNLLPPGWKVIEWVYVDPTDTNFGVPLSGQIAKETFTNIDSRVDHTVLSGLTGAYSVTEVYEIIPAAHGPLGQALSTITVTGAPIPEGSTWALMLTGFAGLAYAALRRKPKPRGIVEAL
jgi:hypothetical protein